MLSLLLCCYLLSSRPLSARSDSKSKSFTDQLLEFSADVILCYLVTSLGSGYCWQVSGMSFLSQSSACALWVMAAGGGQVGDVVMTSVVKDNPNEASGSVSV